VKARDMFLKILARVPEELLRWGYVVSVHPCDWKDICEVEVQGDFNSSLLMSLKEDGWTFEVTENGFLHSSKTIDVGDKNVTLAVTMT